MRTCVLENIKVDKSNLTVTNYIKMRPQRVIHTLFILPRKWAKDISNTMISNVIKKGISGESGLAITEFIFRRYSSYH